MQCNHLEIIDTRNNPKLKPLIDRTEAKTGISYYEYNCKIESIIYKTTADDRKDYCIGKNFVECPRFKAHERFNTKNP
jgi:hypothetical protein